MRLSVTRVVTIAVAFLGLVVGSARAADTPDSWITMKTKLALMTTDGVSTSHLNVDTVKGVVTLHGQVPTAADKAKAGDVAKGIDGTKEVRNLLQVVPKSQRAVVERADDDIKAGVDAAFKANARIKTSDIKVSSVNKGVVLLSGKTNSLATSLESVVVADAVKGVRRVSSEVEVEPSK
jgi:osmotically-inducible protein OsmY